MRDNGENRLEVGVRLYESLHLSLPVGDSGSGSGSGSAGHSDPSLHAKMFSVNQSRVFVGSFNFDPRSATLNTEMEFIIESPPWPGKSHMHFRVTFRTKRTRWAYPTWESSAGWNACKEKR